MPPFEPPKPQGIDRITRLKAYLSFAALKSLLTQPSANRGRERYRRVGVTASSSFLAKALNILISFLSVPLTVHYLGAERYGVWLTISSLLTWMAMTDFGLSGNALINVLAESSGRDDSEGARQYASSAFWVLTSISAVTGIIATLTFFWIPWRAVFRVSAATSSHELYLACGLTLAFFVMGFPLSLQYSTYYAYQDGYLANIWSIATNSVALIALVIVSRFHGGLPQLVFALSGTRTIVGIVNNYYLFRRYPWLIPFPSAVRWSCIRRLFSLGGKYMVMQLGALGMFQSQPMIITQLLGPAKVVIFVVSYKIITLPLDLVYIATQPFVSAFGEAKARHDWRWIKGAYKNATWACIGFGFPVVAIMALCAKPLIRIWAGAEAVPTTSFVLWLSVYVMSAIALTPMVQTLTGLERVNPLALSTTLCAVCVVASTILLVPHWGLGGLGLAMAVSKIVTFWPILFYEMRRFLRSSWTETVGESVAPVS
jgi:O-antigen/teichoic acid export membrane protein